MPISYTTTSSNAKLIDSPFVKLAQYFKLNFDILGMPPIPISGNIPKSDLYDKAVKVLELDGNDSGFVASRLRHLDFAARQSTLANRIDWKSSTAAAWNQVPIYDDATGIKINLYSGNLQLNPVEKFKVTGTRLNWLFLLRADGNQFSIIEDGNFNISFQLEPLENIVVSLSNSGYSLGIRNFLTAGQTASADIKISWPYSGDLVSIKENIVRSTDLLSQLSVTYPDVIEYCQPYSAPEDTVAAFLLAIDSL